MANITAKTKTNGVAKSKIKKGFTLLEIIFVTVIIAILAGMIIPRIIDNAKTSEYLSTLQQDLQSVKAAIGQYKSEGGQINDTFTTDKLENYLPGSIVYAGEKSGLGMKLYVDKNAKNIEFGVKNSSGENKVAIKPRDFSNISDKLKQKILSKIKKEFNCEDGKIHNEDHEIYGYKCKF